jgi:hypothetical protein
MARHYTQVQLQDMTGNELLVIMDVQAQVVEGVELLEDGQRTSNDDHNRMIANINIDNVNNEWARRFEL